MRLCENLRIRHGQVEELLPMTYASTHPETIGASGVQVPPDEAERLFQLDVYEVPIYGQPSLIDPTIRTLDTALSPSRAVPPAANSYWVGETDGPKHLYILELRARQNADGVSGRRPDGRCRRGDVRRSAGFEAALT
jgi:hypothetical protein